MSQLIGAPAVNTLVARRSFLFQSGLLLSGTAVALLAGKDALAAKKGGASVTSDASILNSALGAEFDEPRVPSARRLLRRNHDLLDVPDLAPEEGVLEAQEEPALAHDDGLLRVDLLLLELVLLLRDLLMGRVEEGLRPAGVHRVGVVLEPDDVSLLNGIRSHALTVRGTFGRGAFA